MITYIFIQDASPAQWVALPRIFRKGEKVRRGSDQWGLCRDDAHFGGVETVPCQEEGKELMFTVPVTMLSLENGGSVIGDYRVTRIVS